MKAVAEPHYLKHVWVRVRNEDYSKAAFNAATADRARSVYGNYSVALPDVTYKGIKHKYDFCDYENAQIGNVKKLHSDKISDFDIKAVIPTVAESAPVVPAIQL